MNTEIIGLNRRTVIAGGIACAASLAIGGRALASAPSRLSATGSVGDLDGLARRIHGRFLTNGSRGYDDARKVWNQAYDRRPLAMARCADLNDVRRCVEFARRHDLPIAIRGGAH